MVRLGDLQGGSKDRKDFIDIVRITAELLGGLSAMVRTPELGLADLPAVHQFSDLDVLGLGDLPVVGPILFDQSALVYASWILTLLVALYLGRTRWGLNVRAVGEALDPRRCGVGMEDA